MNELKESFEERAARRDKEEAERREARERIQRAEDRRYWRRMAWLLPLIGIALLILFPVVMVALALWMHFLLGYASLLK